MKQVYKNLSFFISFLVFLFLSCSNQNNFSSSVIFSLSENSARALTDEADGNWNLKINLSGEYKTEKLFNIKDVKTQSFSLDRLPSGKRVFVDVGVYYNKNLYYKNAEKKQITLEEGENSVDILLKKVTRTAAVWLEEKKEDTTVSTLNGINLKQLVSYNSTATESDIWSISDQNSYNFLYCFGSNGNLYTLYSGTLTKYTMDYSTLLYDETGTTQVFNITGTITDMCYDAVNNYVYILSVDGSSGLLYASDGYNTYQYENGFTISASSTTGITPTQIAVNGGTIYVSGNDCNIYSSTVSIEKSSSGSSDVLIKTGEFSTAIAELGTDSVLSDYDSTAHSSGTDYTSLSITDLQIGDGLGNNTDTLYALVREYTDYYMPQENFKLYSRGALVPITISDSKETVGTAIGWSTNIIENIKPTDSTSSYSGTLYAPKSTTEKEFFGPTHFAALVPKKLVIVDDGVVYTGTDDSSGSFKNTDSLVEFDIETNAFERGNSISATVPTVSGFSIQ